jgi:hypothetical protein
MQLARDAYLRLKEKWEPCEQLFEGPPMFMAKEDHLGLQAADVLAYEVGREDVRRYYNPRNEEMRPEWLALQEHSMQNGGGFHLVVHWSPFG